MSIQLPIKDFQLPIKDYGIIGDCRTAALVSYDGSIDWLCLPDFSSPSVFARLIDEDGGCFAVRPRATFTARRRYFDATPVLETTFETAEGIIRLLDFLPVTEGGATTLAPLRELFRSVECIAGSVELEIVVDVKPDYCRTRPLLKFQHGLGWRWSWSNELLLFNTTAQLEASGTILRGTIRLHAGERQFLSLAYVKGDIGIVAPLGEEAEARCERTLAWWRAWVRQCRFNGREREVVIRSALTLKLLTFCLSGAIVAAPTTSLPEALGAGRNWDYRYCWLRDAGLTMSALIGLGFHAEAQAYLDWLLHTTRLTWPRLNILYDVYGRPQLNERQLTHLSGYRGSRPVRVGNAAVEQLQLDVYGQVVMAAEAFATEGGKLDTTEARMLLGFGDVVCAVWREPDNGIWEIPDPRRHYTLSKVLCWAALDRLLSLEAQGMINLGRRGELFRRERDEIARCIEERGFNPATRSYVSELDGDETDAGLLLMACIGYRDAQHPRMISTFDRIQKELGRGGLLYRYRPGRDGIEGKEGAFGICGFSAVDHLAARGQIEEAERYFDHLVSFANDLGLFGEEIDPETGAALGNFPQAFTHVGLIYAALSLEKVRHGHGA